MEKQPLTLFSTLRILTSSAQETRRVGMLLAQLLGSGRVVALIGDLGAGKTCLTQGIAQGLGVNQAVTSPTFIIINEYETELGTTLYHIDCYRFAEDGIEEAVAIGMDELLMGEGICVVEWAERIEPLLPENAITVALRHAGLDTRELLVSAETESIAVLSRDLSGDAYSSTQH